MTLIERIKTDLDNARLSQDSNLLTILITFYAEAQRIGKDARPTPRDTTDSEVISLAKKTIETLNDNSAIYNQRGDKVKVEAIEFEKSILASYIPNQLSEEELKGIISAYLKTQPGLDSRKVMSQVMPYLKCTYPSRYDGNLAKQIVNDILSGKSA